MSKIRRWNWSGKKSEKGYTEQKRKGEGALGRDLEATLQGIVDNGFLHLS